ncbi:uncharacterized protein RSE6_08909 [Rhynchosporium secalis]|uniref:Uncharacterized protein n=1 Tax=Rhynchosporium secalis TaxID=38038 RepID=A0A1E1MGL5_RHYSE|nr:uncharacterized protein RSE6_08909 [Rhynchosporium secalis]
MKLMNYLAKVFRALVVLDFLLAVSKAEAPAVEHVGISISENGASHRWPVTPFRFEGEINGILLNTSEEYKIEEGKPELAEREKLAPDKILCIPIPGQKWYEATESTIQDGIKNLRKLNGVCLILAQNCHRISRSWDAGIYVCNDNPFEARPLCSALASYAQEIATTCRKMHQQRRGWVIGGQAFGNEGFNVIIHDDKC